MRKGMGRSGDGRKVRRREERGKDVVLGERVDVLRLEVHPGLSYDKYLEKLRDLLCGRWGRGFGLFMSIGLMWM